MCTFVWHPFSPYKTLLKPNVSSNIYPPGPWWQVTANSLFKYVHPVKTTGRHVENVLKSVLKNNKAEFALQTSLPEKKVKGKIIKNFKREALSHCGPPECRALWDWTGQHISEAGPDYRVTSKANNELKPPWGRDYFFP